MSELYGNISIAVGLKKLVLLDYMIIDTTEKDSIEIIEEILDTLHEHYALPMESSDYFIKIKNLYCLQKRKPPLKNNSLFLFLLL